MSTEVNYRFPALGTKYMLSYDWRRSVLLKFSLVIRRLLCRLSVKLAPICKQLYRQATVQAVATAPIIYFTLASFISSTEDNIAAIKQRRFENCVSVYQKYFRKKKTSKISGTLDLCFKYCNHY